MSKKEREPSTPESRAEKLANKQMLRKAFTDTFLKALAVCLAVLLIYSVGYLAFFNPNRVPTEADASSNNSVPSNVVQNNDTNTPAQNDANTDNSDNAAAPAVTELTSSSSKAEILAYFNTSINNVKKSAKSVTLVKETNSSAGDIQGNLPSSLTSIANSLISSNMGEKDLSKLDPGLVNATTADQKNAMFPVENENWSSKLTEADIDDATVSEADGKYTITIKVKEDAPSTDTAHGTGHNGKVFSVIMPSIVTDNAGPAASLIKNVQTGHKDGKVIVTVDKATGNVLTANYHYVWTLSLEALGAKLSIPFGLDKQFTIAW